MANLTLPQVRVFQEFNLLPTDLTSSLRALIIGSEYKLHRYDVADEEVLAGTYDPNTDTDFTFSALDKAATSTVDQLYTKVYLKDALLEYFDGTGVGAIVSGTKNRVRLSSYVLKTANGSTLNGAFNDRDVKIGDYAKFSAVVSTVLYEQTAQITGLVADATAASIASATSDTNNQATVTASVPAAMTDGGSNTFDGSTTVAGTYDGIPSGYVTETYTLTCTEGSTGGDLTTATFDITSGSGTDDILGYSPTVAFGVAFALGTRGVTVLLTADGSETDVTEDDVWTITVRSAYNAVTATSGGTYTGSKDTTYILSCTTGGNMTGSSSAVVRITTSNGYDTDAPLTVTAAATPFAIGNYGVTVSFDAASIDRIRKGDKFYIAASAAGQGAIKTLVVDQSLPSQLISGSPALNVQLYIAKDSVELPRVTNADSYVTNWTQDADQVTLEAGATLTDSTWRDGEYGLPVKQADVYVHWRERILDHADKIYTIDNTDDLSDVFSTPVDKDNPLVYAINKALLNSNGVAIRAMAVASEDVDGYNEVLAKAEIRDDVYTIVPLTFTKAIQDQIAGHVDAMSSEENGQWRIAFICSEDENPEGIVTTLPDDDSEDVTATVTANGSYYDIELTSAAISGSATFSEVQVGDLLRINFDIDENGEEVYEEIEVYSVESNTLLKIATAPDPLPGTAVKIQVYRVLDAEDLATQIGQSGGVFASRRVYNVYPDKIESGGETVDGYHLAAAIAGLISGVAPHQGLTNLEITGFDNADKVVNTFNRSQLDAAMSAGRWIVTHDLQTGAVYTRRQVSTDTTDLNTTELSVTKNVDAISYVFRNDLKKYIGRANVTPSLISALETDIGGVINFLKSSGYTETLGAQLIDAKIEEVAQHEVLRDRVVATVTLTIPYALNNLDLHLVI